MSKTIVYIGNFSFPSENSAGIRVLNNGYLLRSLGYEVMYIGLSKELDKFKNLKSTCKTYDNFKYFAFPYPKGIKDWLYFSTQLKEVKGLLKEVKPFSVIAYGSISNVFFALLLGLWCKSSKIKFITDCVDWLSGGSGGMLFRIGKRVDTELQKRYVNASGDGVIAVSSFLAEYYKKKGCKTLVVPPLSKNTVKICSNKYVIKDKTIKLIYAGFPFPTGRRVKDTSFFKDRIDISIELLSNLKAREFSFDIFGLTQSDYLRNVPEHTLLLETLGEKIRFHGVVSNGDVVCNVSKSDYFFLFRDNNRMTNSGFPSKIVEAVSIGIPVITTHTSDLSKYIQEGKNGYIFSTTNLRKNTEELNEIFDKHFDEYERMKEYCVKQNPFVIENFRDDADEFLKNI